MRPHEFWALYRAVYRRRGLLAAIVLSTLTVVSVGCILMPRYYRAYAYVMPSESALSKPVLTGAEATPDHAGTIQRKPEEQFETLIGLAKTAEVRARAVRSLGLAMTASDLEELVQAEPGQGSMIRISALARTREGSIALANAIAQQFVDYYQDLSSEQARQNTSFFTSALADAEVKLEVVKAELQGLKAKEGEAALPVGTSENPFLSQFYSLRSELDATRSQLGEVEGRLAAIRTQLLKEPALRQTEVKTSDNPVVRTLQEEQGRLERELLVMQTRYTEKHRKVVELKAQIEDIQGRIAHEAGQLVAQRMVAANPVYEKLRDQIVDLQAEKQALAAKLRALTQAMQENERRAGQLADSSVLLTAKTAEFDSAQTRVQQLKEMLNAARLGEKVTSKEGELQVVDEAQSATGPVVKSGPSLGQLIVLGLVLSFGLGLGTVIGLEFLDTRVRGRVDLARALELPVPAVIPSLNGSSGGIPLARITDLRPLSPHAEAYRFLRAQLVNRAGAPPLRTLLLATARPGQGGSSTAVNLALSLAEIGERVVLVDADLRRPSLHRFFAHDNEAGLTSVLGNGGEAAHALRATEVPNLFLLPAGPAAENPAALLSSASMRHLLEQLRAHCNYVVIDSPSAGAFADAVMLAPLVDGVILVARANQAMGETERHTKELFRTVGANVVGVVLNDASADNVDTYRFHQNYYQSALALPPGRDGEVAVETTDETATPAAPALQAAAPVAVEPAAASQVAPAPRGERAGRRSGLLQRWQPLVIGVCLLVLVAALASQRRVHERAGRATQGATTPPVAGPAPVTVIAVVKQPTKVRVERDGVLLLDQELTAGQQIWQGSREVSLWVEKPSAVDVTVSRPGSEPEAIGALGGPEDAPVKRRFSARAGGQP